jgi:hypothetical protein
VASKDFAWLSPPQSVFRARLPLRVKGGGAEDARVRSAYPPKLSMKADIPARQPSASSGLMHCSNDSPHSISSSARNRSDVGTLRFSALAVLRLITSSYLVGFCTGKSAGFSPLRMRST